MADPKTFTYKNNSGSDQTVVGVGIVKAGETVTVDEPFSNPNFELQRGKFTSKSQARRVAAAKTPTNDVPPADVAENSSPSDLIPEDEKEQ